MNRTIRYMAVACAVMLACACVKDIPYNGNDSEPMIVINCMARTGEPLDVYVSRSRFFLDTSYDSNKLSDADVSVTINSVTQKPSYDSDEECYSDNRTVMPGDTITVRASHPQFGNATATQVIPMPSTISKEKESRKAFNKNNNWSWTWADSVWSVSVCIKPETAGRHYYRLSLYPERSIKSKNDKSIISVESSRFGLTQSTKMTLGLINQESILDGEDEYSFYYSTPTYTFSDEKLPADGMLTFEIALDRPNEEPFYGYLEGVEEPEEYLWSRDADKTIDYQCRFVLETLSEETYQYLLSAQQYEDSGWSIFSDPVMVLSNVSGGLGILGSSSTSESIFITSYTFE